MKEIEEEQLLHRVEAAGETIMYVVGIIMIMLMLIAMMIMTMMMIVDYGIDDNGNEVLCHHCHRRH